MATPSEPRPGAEPGPATSAPGSAATPPAPEPADPSVTGPATPPTPGPATPPTPASPTPPAAAATPIYPLSLRLEGRRVLVVGGGPVALRRVAGLREAGADIMVVAPRLTPAMGDLADRGLIAAHRREYQTGDTD